MELDGVDGLEFEVDVDGKEFNYGIYTKICKQKYKKLFYLIISLPAPGLNNTFLSYAV